MNDISCTTIKITQIYIKRQTKKKTHHQQTSFITPLICAVIICFQLERVQGTFKRPDD